jgi:hypothetical protein
VGGDLANTSIHACPEKRTVGEIGGAVQAEVEKKKRKGKKGLVGEQNVVKAVAVKQPCQAP